MSQLVPKVARFELKYTLPGTTIANIFHVRCTTTSWAEVDLDAVEQAFEDWFTTTGSQYINDSCFLYEITATDLTSMSGLRKVYPIDPPLAGNMNNELLPANVTFAMKASISTRGRGTSGRTFWPALGDTQVSNENITGAAANLIRTALNTLITDIGAVTNVDALVIPHFVVGGVRPPTVSASDVISYGYSDLVLDSQRCRLPNHKKHKRAGSTP